MKEIIIMATIFVVASLLFPILIIAQESILQLSRPTNETIIGDTTAQLNQEDTNIVSYEGLGMYARRVQNPCTSCVEKSEEKSPSVYGGGVVEGEKVAIYNTDPLEKKAEGSYQCIVVSFGLIRMDQISLKIPVTEREVYARLQDGSRIDCLGVCTAAGLAQPLYIVAEKKKVQLQIPPGGTLFNKYEDVNPKPYDLVFVFPSAVSQKLQSLIFPPFPKLQLSLSKLSSLSPSLEFNLMAPAEAADEKKVKIAAILENNSNKRVTIKALGVCLWSDDLDPNFRGKEQIFRNSIILEPGQKQSMFQEIMIDLPLPLKLGYKEAWNMLLLLRLLDEYDDPISVRTVSIRVNKKGT